MKFRILLAGALSLVCTLASAQPGPGPQPQPGFTGGTLSQPLILTPSTTALSGFNIAPGTAPTSPNNGDVWTTSVGLFAKVGGVIVGPITGAGGSAGQLQTNSGGGLAGITLGGDCTFLTPNVTCTKTSGSPFAQSATTDTTNASNITSGTLSAAVVPTSSILDTLGSTRGSVLERGASGWVIRAPGTSGLPWVSNGTGADPAYQALTGGGIASGTVANSNLANMAAGAIKCRPSGSGTGAPSDCTWSIIHAADFVASGAANAQNATVAVTITGSTSALAVGTATFASTDCQTGTGCTGTNGNKVITVGGIGAAGAPLQTTIAGFTNSTHITLGTTASTSVSGTSEPIVWGTDNTTALQNWLTACAGQTCLLDAGRYLITTTLSPTATNFVNIVGAGRDIAEIIQANPSVGAIAYVTSTSGLAATLYQFKVSQYMPQSAIVALINLAGSSVQQFGSTLVDLHLSGGYAALFASNVQYLNIDRNIWLGQTVESMFYDYPLACATGIGKIENSWIAPASGANGLVFGSEGGFTVINSDVTTQGNQSGTGIVFNSGQACAGGDVYIDNVNLENWAVGIQFSKGSETSGGANHVTNNDFFNNAISINAGDSNANWLLDLSITGNQFYCVTACLNITNSAQNITIVGNAFRNMSGTPTGINVIGNAVTGTAQGNTFAGLTTNVSNASPLFYAESLVNGHLKAVGVAPTISTTNCPSAAVTAGSTDEAGGASFTNAATNCVVTFAHSYGAGPFCTVTINGGSTVGVEAFSTTTQLSSTFTAGPTGLTWTCRGN